MNALVLAAVLAAASPPGRAAVDAQIGVAPFLSGDPQVSSGALIETAIGARAGDVRVQLRLMPLEIVSRQSTSVRLGGFVLAGFESEDLELSAGLGRVVPVGFGTLPNDVDRATFAWFFRMGPVDGMNLAVLGAHGIPAGPVFATLDASFQVPVASDQWLLLRAGAFFGGYEVAEVGLRSRVIRRPAGGGTYLRILAGAHAFDILAFQAHGDVVSAEPAHAFSPSLSLGLEWR